MNLRKIICGLSVIFVFMNCEDVVEPQKTDCTISDTLKLIELTYPVGGETFQKNSTVLVKWKVNKSKMSSLDLEVSVDGKNWVDVLSGSMDVPITNDKYICMENQWIVGAESKTVKYNASGNTTLYLRVSNYDDSEVYSKTESITITP